MNKLKANRTKSKDGYIEYLQFVVDNTPIDILLDNLCPDNNYEGLVPTVSSWMEDDKEKQIVWDRILPAENSSALAPILMCPDDCDFSCTIIIAEVLNQNGIITWNRIGIDSSDNCIANPKNIGQDVKWFINFTGFKFEIGSYREVISKFKKNMVLDNIKFEIKKWVSRIKEAETLPNEIKALNFGLFESESDYQIYLTGSINYSKVDDDWVCDIDYEPQEKYFIIPIRDEKLEWSDVLNLSIQALKEYLVGTEIFPNIEYVTTGFDDGDLSEIRFLKTH